MRALRVVALICIPAGVLICVAAAAWLKREPEPVFAFGRIIEGTTGSYPPRWRLCSYSDGQETCVDFCDGGAEPAVMECYASWGDHSPYYREWCCDGRCLMGSDGGIRVDDGPPKACCVDGGLRCTEEWP